MPIVLAVAGLEDVVVAFFALLFITATYPLWSRALVSLLAQLPLVGSWASSHADQLVSAMFSAMSTWVNSSLGPLTNLFRSLEADGKVLILGTEHALRSTYQLAHGLLWVTIPHALAAARTYALQVAQEAIAHADQLAAQLGAAIAAVEAAARAFAWALYQQAIAHAEALVQGARSELLAGIAAAEALGRREAEQARAYALQAVQALQARVYGDLWRVRDQAQADLGAFRDWTRARLGELGRAIEGAETRSRAYTDAAAAAAAAALALGLSRVLSRVKAIEDSPCQQECATLGNLGGETSALSVALVFALVAAAEHDPRGAARAVVSTLGQEYRDAAETMRSLVGAA